MTRTRGGQGQEGAKAEMGPRPRAGQGQEGAKAKRGPRPRAGQGREGAKAKRGAKLRLAPRPRRRKDQERAEAQRQKRAERGTRPRGGQGKEGVQGQEEAKAVSGANLVRWLSSSQSSLSSFALNSFVLSSACVLVHKYMLPWPMVGLKDLASVVIRFPVNVDDIVEPNILSGLCTPFGD